MSNIIYAPKSWNPISGCSPISEGCANCWAKVMARRQRQEWGIVHLHPERLDQPLHWRKPQTVAVAFMGDWCHPGVPDAFIDQVFAVMALTPQHTYLLLTKRPERMRAYLNGPPSYPFCAVVRIHDEILRRTGQPTLVPWPLPNVWLGVSAENQARADERIPILLDTPAAHRWVSLEPLLGPIDICLSETQRCYCGEIRTNCTCPSLDWVVCGGESGPHARPCDLGWIRDIRDQSKAAGVPCYVKQMGANPRLPTGGSYWNYYTQDYAAYKRRDRKGENPDEWPADLRVREMPEGSE